MLTVIATIFQQIIGAKSQEDRIMVITKIVLKVMKQNGRWSS
jgi:hypothetical protein